MEPKGKRVPTPLFRRHVRRPRLTALLDESAAQAILLVAPAGYGKTSLVTEWVENRESVVWYRATESSEDLAAFSVGVAEAIEAIVPDAATSLHQRVRVAEQPEKPRPSPCRTPRREAGGLAKRSIARPRRLPACQRFARGRRICRLAAHAIVCTSRRDQSASPAMGFSAARSVRRDHRGNTGRARDDTGGGRLGSWNRVGRYRRSLGGGRRRLGRR